MSSLDVTSPSRYMMPCSVFVVMIGVLYLALMQSLHGAEVPCKHCVFLPWPALLLVYLSCMMFRRVEQTCSGVLLIGVHAAAVAVLFTHNPKLAFACSLHSLFHLLPRLASDEVTTCVLSCFCIMGIGVIVSLCSYRVPSDILLVALVWPCVIDVVYAILNRLLWGEWHIYWS